MRLTRSQVSRTSDFQQVAEASLQQNSDALSQLVETAYDDTQRGRFQQLWQGYVSDLSTYASAAASQDASAKQQARADLMAYCDNYGRWLATASQANRPMMARPPMAPLTPPPKGSAGRSVTEPPAMTSPRKRS